MQEFKTIVKQCMREAMKKSPFLRKNITRTLNSLKRKKYKKYLKQEKIDEQQILFEAYQGDSYSCSPKAIYEYLIADENFSNFKMVWSIKKRKFEEIQVPGPARCVVRGSEEFYKMCAQTKYFITNTSLPKFIEKQSEQILVECWHGTPLKRLGYDIVEGGGGAINNNKDIKKKYASDARQFDYLISPSKFCTEKLRSAFNLTQTNKSVKFIEEGYPRNDFLYNFTDQDVRNIKGRLGIAPDDTRTVLLYAPTWRDTQYTAESGYVYDLKIDLQRWQKLLEKDFILLCRLHTLVAKEHDLSGFGGFAYDVSQYDDIAELYVISDILVTDYSSAFFDYANLKRPIIFYMYDLEEYRDEVRGFYLDLEELPGEVVRNETELVDMITKNKYAYGDKYKMFNETYNYLDDGHATERVVACVFGREICK